MPPVEVTTWYLEQRDSSELRPATRPLPAGIEVAPAPQPRAELGRLCYASVGRDWQWGDRLAWPKQAWCDWYEQPGVDLWPATDAHGLVGYFELHDVGGDVELAYFGLVARCLGRGLGGALLTRALDRAWQRPGARRVWVHTCSLDHPAALANYRARGMRVYDVVTAVQDVVGRP